MPNHYEFGKPRSTRIFNARVEPAGNRCEDCGMSCNVNTGMELVVIDGVKLCEDCAQDVFDACCDFCRSVSCHCDEIDY